MINANLAVPRNAKCSFEIMAEKMGMSDEEMRSGLEGIRQPDLAENAALLTDPSSSLYASGERIVDFYLKRSQLSDILDIKDTIEPRVIKELVKQ